MVIGVESVLDVIIHHYLDRFKYIDALASPSLRWTVIRQLSYPATRYYSKQRENSVMHGRRQSGEIGISQSTSSPL